MKLFKHLRLVEWSPKFVWMRDPQDVAQLINVWHEYPPNLERIMRISRALRRVRAGEPLGSFVSLPNLLSLHNYLFAPEPIAGRLRQVNIFVGNHRPPQAREVEGFLKELCVKSIQTLDDLKDWYYDFETIHPFEDGNGRVGGTVVAACSHILLPEVGWLTVLQ